MLSFINKDGVVKIYTNFCFYLKNGIINQNLKNKKVITFEGGDVIKRTEIETRLL